MLSEDSLNKVGTILVEHLHYSNEDELLEKLPFFVNLTSLIHDNPSF